jgi:hypothetical protein
MRRSSDRILTTHLGSLPAPEGVDLSAPGSVAHLRETVDSIVDKQVALGIDIVNDGELSKGNWLGYLNARLSGFEQRPAVPGPSFLSQGKDCEEFSGYYSEAMRLGTMFYSSGYQHASPSSSPTKMVCTGPIAYQGASLIRRDVANLRAAVARAGETERRRSRFRPYLPRSHKVKHTWRKRMASRSMRACGPVRMTTRPAVSNERVALTDCDHVRYSLKTPYRDGTTHVYFNPLDFIARLAALVPKPRVNLTRFHGVFAPNSKLRSQVTLSGRGKRPAQAPQTAAERHQAMSCDKGFSATGLL